MKRRRRNEAKKKETRDLVGYDARGRKEEEVRNGGRNKVTHLFRMRRRRKEEKKRRETVGRKMRRKRRVIKRKKC